MAAALALAAASALPLASQAQTAPDAGRVLQEQTTPAPALPPASPRLDFSSPVPATAPAGGAAVRIARVEITGNTVLPTEELLAVLGDVSAQPLDLAGLQGLAATLTRHYHAAGFPFARVFLPAQALEAGVLRLQVVEGRYGRVAAEGEDAALVAAAQSFLGPLRPGEVIESASLERSALLLADLPGLVTTPRLRPGAEVGTGDLLVQVERGPRVAGSVGLDNQGNRYTGALRAYGDLRLDSALLAGDQASVRLLRASEDLWLGSLGYGLALGGSGLRARLGYAHTAYALGKEFASLDAHGTARVASAGLSYPLVRSQRRNLSVDVDVQHKELRDDYRTAGVRQDKFSNSVPVALRFDVRDGLGGAGVTYGALAWTAGTLKLDAALAASDAQSARSAGRFDKLNLDVARLQALAAGWSLHGRLSGQWSRDNLDASEDFGLGGPGGVRAYPVGEGYGDRGWLGQLELRYAAGALEPFVFYDGGRVRLVSRPWQAGENHRGLGGAGVGARLAWGGWRAEASVAWRTSGGAPRSDSRRVSPVAWVSAVYGF